MEFEELLDELFEDEFEELFEELFDELLFELFELEFELLFDELFDDEFDELFELPLDELFELELDELLELPDDLRFLPFTAASVGCSAPNSFFTSARNCTCSTGAVAPWTKGAFSLVRTGAAACAAKGTAAAAVIVTAVRKVFRCFMGFSLMCGRSASRERLPGPVYSRPETGPERFSAFARITPPARPSSS
ncbi:MAG: hypothetical protein ACK4GO_04835 [Gemmobacter sp.]